MVSHSAPIRNEPPLISASDRLGLALFLAATLHAIVILGVTFHLGMTPESRSRSLEITLVHSSSDQAPEQADYLAQANQQGGGNVEERVRPSSPFPNPRPSLDRGDSPTTREASAPPPQPQNRTQVITAPDSSRQAPNPEQVTESPVEQLPEAAELVTRSLEIARLSAEIRQSQQIYAQQPRREYITANTRAHDSAAYEEAWRMKVERIGNLNYPDEAKRRKLSGILVLNVAIAADGRLLEARVVRSSGQPVLDDAAVRIVELASPYAPFPESLRQRADIIHITRSWLFESDNSFRGQ